MKHACFCVATAAVALLGLAAPAQAFHVSCGEVITVSTKLDSDVMCPAGAQIGLIIGADNVTLQLAGYAIRGQGGDTGVYGVPGTGFLSGVQVRNGTIEGFGAGVRLNADDSSIQALNVTAPGEADISAAGITVFGERTFAFRNVIEVTPGTGGFGGVGLWLDGNYPYVVRNTIRGIPNVGITAGGQNPRIVENTVESCDDPVLVTRGIEAGGASGFARISFNKVTGCNLGIFVAAQDAGLLDGARVRGNETSGNSIGMSINDSDAALTLNTANGNSDTGIVVHGQRNTLTQNTANDNGSYGIVARPDAIDRGGNRASGNGIQDCVDIICSP